MGSAFNLPNNASPPGMTQLQQVITSGSATTISFTGIPSNYTDLVIKFSGCATGAAGASTVYLQINSDSTAANYLAQQVVYSQTGTGPFQTAIASTTRGAATFGTAGTANGSNPLTEADISLSAYASTVLTKGILCTYRNYQNAGSGSQQIVIGSSQWLSTAAINRIDLTIASGSFLDGTTCTIYGLGNGPGYSRGYDEGIVFPTTNLVVNKKFYRTDLNLLCYYDGTRWLTVNEYVESFACQDTLGGTTTAPVQMARGLTPTDFSIYLTKIYCNTYTAASNNGSNFYTYTFTNFSGYSFNTSADTAAVFTNHSSLTVNTVLASNIPWQIDRAKTGAPGLAYLVGHAVYRLIVT